MASIKDAIRHTASSAVNLYKTHQEPLKKAKALAEEGASFIGHAKDAFEVVRAKAGKVAHHAADGKGLLGKLTRFAGAAKVVGLAVEVQSFPGQVLGAVKDARDAVRSGSRADASKALESGRGALRSSAELAELAVKTGRGAAAAGRALATRFPAAVARAASSSLGRASIRATEGAAHALAAGATRVGASALGKAAARFAPGMNVAMAGFDTAMAGATLVDPKASLGKKVGACLTAAGSIAAATNIPVVSQVGAAVSAASTIVSSFF